MTPPELAGGQTFEVWFEATTGSVSGSAVVDIFANDEDDGTSMRIDEGPQTINI